MTETITFEKSYELHISHGDVYTFNSGSDVLLRLYLSNRFHYPTAEGHGKLKLYLDAGDYVLAAVSKYSKNIVTIQIGENINAEAENRDDTKHTTEGGESREGHDSESLRPEGGETDTLQGDVGGHAGAGD